MIDRRKMMFAGMMGAVIGGACSLALSLVDGRSANEAIAMGILVSSTGCFVVAVLFGMTGRDR